MWYLGIEAQPGMFQSRFRVSFIRKFCSCD
jgi:hypothetical protein